MGSARPTPKIVYYPQIFTITASSNDRLDFRETASTDIAASLTPGEYSLAGLAAEVKRALDAAGASTYTVTYNLSGASINKFTIVSDGTGGTGVLKLMGATGPNVARSAMVTLGYAASDLTGALTYTSSSVAPAAVTLTFDEDIRRPEFEEMQDASVVVAASGIRQQVVRHIDVLWTVHILYCTRATAESWESFMYTCATRGGQFDFYPKSGTATWVNYTLASPNFSMREMIAENLFQFFAFDLKFREVLPNETINSPGGRGSRARTTINRSQWIS